ncbi:TRAP transporter large permease [Petroclostridium sp. X23]|uniref:TRAP transporter large permease n=1 Tax=Petroclostridium sp. X23 TaxID=3045146 RepID=UPI0024AE1969|nr:TRAP transporter large permease [Petroclostridium sp. X23]WHH59097.1 TRAP transporter large permease [Petroclostridium sp. X23]
MPVMSITLVILAIVLLVVGAPIAIALGLSSVVVIMIFQPVPNMQLIPQLFSEASTSFVLLAVPLFILAGSLMERGTVGRNLIEFTNAIVGWATGGLGAVNIVGSMIFGGISGSSLADTATFGSILVPRMVEDGYPKDYAGAVTLTSSSLSVVIPPSILLVLGAAATQQSVARALAGGLLPGILITVALLIPNYYISKKNNYGHKTKFSIKNVMEKVSSCWTALVAPLIILGTIFSGIVTPTEGAAVAVLYILIIDGLIFKKLKRVDLVEAFKSTAVLTSAILFIATSSAITNFIIAYEGVPKYLAEQLANVPGGQIGFLLLMDLVLIMIGMTIDASPATLIFTPLFLPIAMSMGIDPTHFIVITVMGFALGLTTPPYGVCLFSIASVCKISMDKLVRKAMPFYVAMFITLILVTLIPQLSLFLPKVFGL